MSAPDRPRAGPRAVINSILLLLALIAAVVLFFVFAGGTEPLLSLNQELSLDRWLT